MRKGWLRLSFGLFLMAGASWFVVTFIGNPIVKISGPGVFDPTVLSLIQNSPYIFLAGAIISLLVGLT